MKTRGHLIEAARTLVFTDASRLVLADRLPKPSEITELAERKERMLFYHFSGVHELYTEAFSSDEFAQQVGKAWMRKAGIGLPPRYLDNDASDGLMGWFAQLQIAAGRLWLDTVLGAMPPSRSKK